MKKSLVHKTVIVRPTIILALWALSVLMLLIIAGCSAQENTIDTDLKSIGQETNNQSVLNGNSFAGQESALKIIIYTDFMCGACERFHTEVEPKLREFEAAGLIKSEIRLLGVLSEDSIRAAEATLYAADHNRFIDYHDALFRKWDEEDDDPFTKEKLIELAGSLGLDKQALRYCLDNQSKRPQLETNRSLSRADGVGTLPAVLIDDVKIEGFKPLETYIQIIDSKLTERLSQ